MVPIVLYGTMDVSVGFAVSDEMIQRAIEEYDASKNECFHHGMSRKYT